MMRDAYEPDWLKHGPADIRYMICDKCKRKLPTKLLEEYGGKMICPECIADDTGKVYLKQGYLELRLRINLDWELWRNDEKIFKGKDEIKALEEWEKNGGRV